MHSLYCRTQNALSCYYCSAEDLFILNSHKFRMVYKVDGNPQFNSCDWSMYSNILNRSDFWSSALDLLGGLQRPQTTQNRRKCVHVKRDPQQA